MRQAAPRVNTAEHARRSAALEAKERANVRADMEYVAADPRGRRFLWRLLSKCHVYGEVFNTNGSIMAHQAGMRTVGLNLVIDMGQVDPALIYKIALENKDAQQEEKQDANT